MELTTDDLEHITKALRLYRNKYKSEALLDGVMAIICSSNKREADEALQEMKKLRDGPEEKQNHRENTDLLIAKVISMKRSMSVTTN